MPTIQRSALLPYAARRVFDLVNDVESYPQFMDGCVGAQVLRRDSEVMEARLDLSRAGLAHSFSTRNTMVGSEAIELELLEGPFQHFRGRWEFLALGEQACKVSLNLDFKLNNSVLGAAAGRLFDAVTTNLVDSLGKRAHQVYGRTA